MNDSFNLLANLFMAYVGAGVLDLSYGFRKAGILPGALIMSGVAALSMYAMHILIDCKYKLLESASGSGSGSGSGRQKRITHGDVAHAAFGSVGRRIMDFSLTLAQLGFGSAYLLFICENMSTILSWTSKDQWLVSLLMPLFILTTIKDLNKFAVFSLVSQFANIFAFVTILWCEWRRLAGAGQQEAEAGRQNSPETELELEPEPGTETSSTLRDLFFFFSLSIYSYEGAGLVLALEDSAVESVRPRFKTYFCAAIVTITSFYVVFGGFGFLAFGAETQEMITMNLPAGQGLLQPGLLVKACLCFSLFFSYPLMLFPLSMMLDERVAASGLFGGRNISNLLRLGLVTVTAVLIELFPSFADLLEVVGATCCTMVAYIMPGLCHLVLFRKGGGGGDGDRDRTAAGGATTLARGLDCLLVAVGGLGATLGLADLVVKLTSKE